MGGILLFLIRYNYLVENLYRRIMGWRILLDLTISKSPSVSCQGIKNFYLATTNEAVLEEMRDAGGTVNSMMGHIMKLLERLLKPWLVEAIEAVGGLSDRQHGFRSTHPKVEGVAQVLQAFGAAHFGSNSGINLYDWRRAALEGDHGWSCTELDHETEPVENRLRRDNPNGIPKGSFLVEIRERYCHGHHVYQAQVLDQIFREANDAACCYRLFQLTDEKYRLT
ncbi:hypothetical protein J6590_014319 [Homalodisca vitripennis]|nr:hypothetical protein J6590_014319 [Homalodisca vitripennis]